MLWARKLELGQPMGQLMRWGVGLGEDGRQPGGRVIVRLCRVAPVGLPEQHRRRVALCVVPRNVGCAEPVAQALAGTVPAVALRCCICGFIVVGQC